MSAPSRTNSCIWRDMGEKEDSKVTCAHKIRASAQDMRNSVSDVRPSSFTMLLTMLSCLFSQFSRHENTPPPAGVRIIPCTAVDRFAAHRHVLTPGLVINARLDTKILEESMSRLIEHKFPRAGARLAFRNGVRHIHWYNLW
jgi:hypothetical protein